MEMTINMTYIVMEIQANDLNTAVVPPITYTNLYEAESKFHQILASAAVSAVEEHTAVLLTSGGQVLRTECYHHILEENEET